MLLIHTAKQRKNEVRADRQHGDLHTAGGRVNGVATMKHSWEFPHKVKCEEDVVAPRCNTGGWGAEGRRVSWVQGQLVLHRKFQGEQRLQRETLSQNKRIAIWTGNSTTRIYPRQLRSGVRRMFLTQMIILPHNTQKMEMTSVHHWLWGKAEWNTCNDTPTRPLLRERYWLQKSCPECSDCTRITTLSFCGAADWTQDSVHYREASYWPSDMPALSCLYFTWGQQRSFWIYGMIFIIKIKNNFIFSETRYWSMPVLWHSRQGHKGSGISG